MTQIEFQDDREFHIRSPRLLGEPETPTMVKLLLKYGWAKNEKQAVIILAGVCVACVLLSIGIFYQNNFVSSDTVIFKDGTKTTIDEYLQGLRSGKYKN